MSFPNECPICLDRSAQVERTAGGKDSYRVRCPKCKTYEISGTAAHSDLGRFGPRHVMSGIIRNRNENGDSVNLGTNTLEHLVESVTYPGDPFGKMDLLLQHVMKGSGRIDKAMKFNGDVDFPLLYAEDGAEFWFYVKKATDLKFLEQVASGYRLTLDGWDRLQKIQSRGVRSDQAFVAMWFDRTLDSAWNDGFKAALVDCGLRPLRIDLEEHNEKICDQIIAEIRRSGLVVADFTGQRGGVYYESGFAHGFGVPVIRTCRMDNIDLLHFDTRQYSHVVWETPEDLKKKLINRIRATFLRFSR